MHKLVRLALSCSFAVGLAACADEEQSGNLTIHYELGASQSTCDEAAVEQVRASFTEDLDELELCNDEGDFTASGIPARSYNQFLLEGIDAEGVTVFDSLGDPAQSKVTVTGGSTQMVEMFLTPTPAQIKVSFNLLNENGFGYSGQEQSPVTEFDVRAFDNDSPMLNHTFVVAQLEAVENNVIPDEARVLNGLRLNQVRINYVADGDQSVVDVMGEPLFTFEPPGRGRVVDIIVECRADVCTGVLKDIEGGVDLTAGGDSATGDSGTG
jgi:hypothetical protein